MRAAGFSMILAAAAVMVAAPCRADPPLAGAHLFTVSHGQPFCTDKEQLKALLRAQISHLIDRYDVFNGGASLFPGCGYIPDNTIVEVLDDEGPRSRYMHVVRARAPQTFGGVAEGYTFSVGLSPFSQYEPFRIPRLF